jgi:hypothetical protein
MCRHGIPCHGTLPAAIDIWIEEWLNKAFDPTKSLFDVGELKQRHS